MTRNIVPAIVAAAIVLAAQMLSPTKLSAETSASCITSWFGNSFGGAPFVTAGGWTDAKHVQLAIDDMAVDTDGTVYTDSSWDEGGNEAGIYQNDDIIGRCQDLSHGWGRGGGKAVAVDDHYVYVAMSQSGDDGADMKLNANGLRRYPDRGTVWQCVRRFHKNGARAPFPTGYGVWGDMMIVNTATREQDRPQRQAGYPDIDIMAMAVRGGVLYVSNPSRGQIESYDTGQMSGTPKAFWKVASPSKIACDKNGRIWVLEASGDLKIVCFDESGHLQTQQITFGAGMSPAGIAWDNAAQRLLVSDKGPDQNIKLYDPAHLSGSPTAPASTFGVKGGIHAGVDGRPGPLRFCNPAGVGADRSGNIYVVNSPAEGNSSGMSIESYRSNGTPNWKSPLQCLQFVNCADADPLTDTDIFTTTKRFQFDYGQPPGKGWTFQGLTIDRFKYPDDPRLHLNFSGGVWIRRIHGERYLFATQQMGHSIAVFRFNADDGEVARPYALISGWIAPGADGWPKYEPGTSTAKTDWIWRDSDRNGMIDAGEFSFPSAVTSASVYNAGWGEWVDQTGDIWQCGHRHIRHFKMHLDSNGRPKWDYAEGDAELLGPPALPNGATWQHGRNSDDDDMDRIVYEPATDTMYISGFTTDYPDDTAGAWGWAGRVLYRYDNWSGARTIHAGYPIALPWDSRGDTSVKSISIAGDYVFAARGKDPETVTVYDADSAAIAGTFGPDAAVGSKSGWVDMNYGLTAHRRSNGDYIIFAEEDLDEKGIVYRWHPPKKRQ